MTAPPDVEQPPAVDPAWDERPIVGNARGLPWWAAVLLAFLVAALAAWIDIHRQDSLGRLYQGAYVLGCLIAVCAVRRRNLFGPMVQPPLVFAVTAIGAVVLSQPGPLFGTGIKQLVFSVALPLTSNFPTMAITTGVTVAIGLARLWLQRNPFPNIKSNRRGHDPDALDLLDARSPRTPEPGAPGRTRDRAPRPDRARPGRSRADQEPGPGSGRGRTDQDPGAGGRGRADQEPGSAGRSRFGRDTGSGRDTGRGRADQDPRAAGRGRADQDPGEPRPRPGRGTRRSEPRDQPPPRSGRGRTDPPPDRRGRATPPPDQRRRQPDEPRRDPDRPRRRRPPDGDR